jgi:hypothetical protein
MENTNKNNNISSDNIYKIFVFDSNTGNLIKTEDYGNLIETQKEVIEYNKNNLTNRWNLHFGTEFPPKGVKFDLEIKQFINKTLAEQYADGEIQIPSDFKIVNNALVRLTKKELVEKDLLKLEYDEKIDELDSIVKLTKKEMYDLGKITKFQVYEYFIQELNIKIENKLKNFYNYPMQEMGTWALKKDQSVKWTSLNLEEKQTIMNDTSIVLYNLLISEANIQSLNSIDEKINKVDILSNKIIVKYSELEKIYGEMFNLRSSVKEELRIILEKNNINTYEEMENDFNSIEK